MKLTATQRESIRLMFGGRCSYCGSLLEGKWHVDHMLPVERETVFTKGINKVGYSKTRVTGKMRNPHNDILENCAPACIKCNILKSNSTPEQFRSTLTYFAHSIPRIRTYSHVHHLMRFQRLTISMDPIVFWYETYALAAQEPPK